MCSGKTLTGFIPCKDKGTACGNHHSAVYKISKFLHDNDDENNAKAIRSLIEIGCFDIPAVEQFTAIPRVFSVNSRAKMVFSKTSRAKHQCTERTGKILRLK